MLSFHYFEMGSHLGQQHRSHYNFDFFINEEACIGWVIIIIHVVVLTITINLKF
jgi:hypothetical protein